jgi:predicted PurR-regulated permease PerM
MTGPRHRSPAEDGVPASLRVAAALAWRILVVAAFLLVLGLAVARLRLVVVPSFIALLLAAFLTPPTRRLRSLGVPSSLAALLTMLATAAVIAGIVAALAPQVASEVDEIDLSATEIRDDFENWLVTGPLDLSQERVAELFDRVDREVRQNQGTIAAGAFSGALVAVEILAGLALALVVLFFFLRDGPRMWAFLVGLFPAHVRADVHIMGGRAWTTLSGFLRGTAIVAAFDAFFIGLAIYLLGVPLVIPLALLTFLGGFVPIVGAFAAGIAAVAVALVTEGTLDAAILLGAILAVQQLEGNVLQPAVVGRNVELHPLVILLAVTTGAVLWGIVGAFVAVPIASAAWAAISYLREKRGEAAGTPAEAG